MVETSYVFFLINKMWIIEKEIRGNNLILFKVKLSFTRRFTKSKNIR